MYTEVEDFTTRSRLTFNRSEARKYESARRDLCALAFETCNLCSLQPRIQPLIALQHVYTQIPINHTRHTHWNTIHIPSSTYQHNSCRECVSAHIL